jgi:HEAT repeat protein
MRVITDKPEVVKKPVGPPPSVREKDPLEPAKDLTPAEVKNRIDEILKKFHESTAESKSLSVKEIAATGEEGSAYLASLLPSLDQNTRMHAASVLAELKHRKCIPVLEKLLAHEEGGVRAAAAGALSGMGDAQKIRYLKPLLRDRDPGVRKAVVGMLGRVEEKDWLEVMVDLLGDKDRDVRSQALTIGGRLAATHKMQGEYLRMLTAALGRLDGPQKADVVAGIASFAKGETWSILTPLLRDGDPSVRSATALALMNLGVTQSGPDIVAALRSERDRLTRVYLAGAAQKLRLANAVEPLVGWLSDSDKEIARVAATSLRAITGQDFGSDLNKWNAWLASRRGSP